MIGKTISHYKILEKLGEGGMGQVYKAEDTKLKRVVALKFLPHHLVAGKSIKERFFHEARAASALNHPNIITIYDIHEEDGEVFLAMECVDGDLLSDKLKDGPLKQQELISIAIGIADGLNAAHNADITHRDIKSENIIITKDGLAKIIDFGLAKQKGMSQITQDGTTLGTQGYMSPEQVQGVEADRRSDIFSFGVVLYQMATGKLPFEGEHEAAVLYSIVNEAPIPVTTHNPNMDEELQRIINKALEKDVKDRYQHADDLLADLRKLKKGKTQLAKKEPGLKSIAILPFTSIDRTEESEIFCDGIHDDILSQVAKIHDLKVVSRTSVTRYKDTNKRIKEISQELGVGTILEGSVRRAGKKVRIVAQLINAKTDNHLWAETYDRDYEDIFAIQSDVAENIASALKATLTPKEIRSIKNEPTENMEAYNYYLKGKYYWDNKTDRDGKMMAADMLDRAVGLDQSFIIAYALLAEVDFTLYSRVSLDPTPQRLEKGKQALKKATQLDPDLPEVHYAQAMYYITVEKDHKKALIDFLKVLNERPNDSWLNQSIGKFYMVLGEWDKAERYLLKSYELDPHGLLMATSVANYYTRMRDWKKAEYYIDKAIVSLPEVPDSYMLKALIALMGYGNTEKASQAIDDGVQNAGNKRMLVPRVQIDIWLQRFKELSDAVEPFPNFYTYSFMKGLSYWFMGQKDQAKAYIESAREVHEHITKTNPHNIANYSYLGFLYAGLGMNKKAVQSAKKAIELEPIGKNAFDAPDRHRWLAYVYSIISEYEKALDEIEFLLSIPYYFTAWELKLNPIWDPLRDHPRFQELIVKYEEKD